MTITIFQKKVGDLYGEIYLEKDSSLFNVSIWYKNSSRIYYNYFIKYKNARQALNRNMKKYLD